MRCHSVQRGRHCGGKSDHGCGNSTRLKAVSERVKVLARSRADDDPWRTCDSIGSCNRKSKSSWALEADCTLRGSLGTQGILHSDCFSRGGRDHPRQSRHLLYNNCFDSSSWCCHRELLQARSCLRSFHVGWIFHRGVLLVQLVWLQNLKSWTFFHLLLLLLFFLRLCCKCINLLLEQVPHPWLFRLLSADRRGGSSGRGARGSRWSGGIACAHPTVYARSPVYCPIHITRGDVGCCKGRKIGG